MLSYIRLTRRSQALASLAEQESCDYTSIIIWVRQASLYVAHPYRKADVVISLTKC
jgi:hypothetical protein